MVADSKKCQTLINIVGESVTELKRLATRLKACRTAYQTQGVDPTGTPLDGNIPAISNWIDNVDAVANSAVANGFVDAIVPTHKNNALGGL